VICPPRERQIPYDHLFGRRGGSPFDRAGHLGDPGGHARHSRGAYCPSHVNAATTPVHDGRQSVQLTPKSSLKRKGAMGWTPRPVTGGLDQIRFWDDRRSGLGTGDYSSPAPVLVTLYRAKRSSPWPHNRFSHRSPRNSPHPSRARPPRCHSAGGGRFPVIMACDELKKFGKFVCPCPIEGLRFP
jgi:hypothetical protein